MRGLKIRTWKLWRLVRRTAGNWDRRWKIGVMKGYTKQTERRTSVLKHVIVEDHLGDAQSSLQIANMSCGMTQDTLLEVVNHCLAGMLQRFAQSVPHKFAQPVETIVQIPAIFCG